MPGKHLTAAAGAAMLAATACGSTATSNSAAPTNSPQPSPTSTASCNGNLDVLLNGQICITVLDEGVHTPYAGTEQESFDISFQNLGTGVYSTRFNSWVGDEGGKQVIGDDNNQSVTLAPEDVRVLTVTFAGSGIDEIIYEDPSYGDAYWRFQPDFGSPTPSP